MTPIIEVPIPPVPAEQREPLLVPFDPGTGTDAYVNALYEYVHKLAMSGEDPGIIVKRRGARLLILLPHPILGMSTTSDYSITFCAALLHEGLAGAVDGWLISTHAAALETWDSAERTEPAE